MILSDDQIRQIGVSILPTDIRTYCIDNYKEFNEFQLDGQEPYIFTEIELNEFDKEMILLWLSEQ